MNNLPENKSGAHVPIKIERVGHTPSSRSRAWLPFLVIVLLLVAGGAIWYVFFHTSPETALVGEAGGSLGNQAPPEVPAPSQHGPQVPLEREQADAREQDERKASFGLNQSLDVVVRSDESIVLNDNVVSMAELARELDRYRGQVSDQSLEGRDQLSAWGVYRVRPGDNLWNIHLALLTEYLAGHGVKLAPGADQPKPTGYSSGVGRILKFAEHMVGVYNVKTRRMSHNINLLEPGEKIVVFNLSEIFGQLKGINPQDLDGVMFDGRVLIFNKK